MYGYQDYIELHPEQLLQKITQQEIFEFVLKVPFNFGLRYTSPFRNDKKPDCRFEQREDGTIIFVDFGEKLLRPDKTHRTCFKMVMEAYDVSLESAMRIICTEFGLSTDKRDYLPVTTLSYEKSTVSSGAKLSYESKEYNKADKLFWSQFLIRPEHLLEDNVFSVRKFSIDSHKGYRVITPYRYCYVFDFLSEIKIYQPYNEKYKFITNCHENNIGNIDNLPPTGKELIIKKSYKDHRVLRNLDLGLNVIWFQNEGCVPSMDILRNLTERFELITFFYDNDEDGITAANKLVSIMNDIKPNCSREIHLPHKRKHKSLYGKYLKDPAEFIHREGRQDLITILKQIGINGKNS